MIPISFDDLMAGDNFIHIAALFYLSGFLFRNALLLRSLIIVGDIIYILYFYLAPETPLWGGISWSAMFCVVNLWMVGQIVADRMHFNLTPEQRKLFDMLGELSPGQFRKFIRLGSFQTAAQRKPVTREGWPLEWLYFVLDGSISIEKRGTRDFTEARTFIGEDAFLLEGPSAATVTLEPGAHYFVWNVKALRKLLESNGELNTALTHAINRKLVQKVMRATVSTDTVILGRR